MAMKLCSFNCRGFNISKVKHLESILLKCDILLIQETWLLSNQVGKLNEYFIYYNTCGQSSIKDINLLTGRPYGELSFLYKKSLSNNIEWLEINCARLCCIRINTKIGFLYVFNVYMPCDSILNLEEYNNVLSIMSAFFITHNVLQCIIGGDMNTDLSRLSSGNTISLNRFILQEDLKYVLNDKYNINIHKYTYCKIHK